MTLITDLDTPTQIYNESSTKKKIGFDKAKFDNLVTE